MATDNKAVTTYLPEEVEKSLTKYCINKGLVRKDKKGKTKPSLGTGIVEILKDYFSIVELEDSDLTQKLKDCFEDRVKDLVHDLVNKELSSIGISGQETVDQVQEKVQYQDIKQTEQANEQFNNRVSDSVDDSVNNSTQTKPLINIPVSQQEILLEGKNLALRLNVSASKISNIKSNKETFSIWSRENDPDGIEWNFKSKTTGKGVFYFPKTESLTDNVLSNLLKWIEDNLS